MNVESNSLACILSALSSNAGTSTTAGTTARTEAISVPLRITYSYEEDQGRMRDHRRTVTEKDYLMRSRRRPRSTDYGSNVE